MDKAIGIRQLLVDCNNAGIEIKLDGDSILVRGNQERSDLYAQIKDHKDTIVYALSNIPDAVETYYLSRLRKGQRYLQNCMEVIGQQPDNKDMIDKLVNNLIKWQLWDDELRRIDPEYKGCPLEKIGGCDFAYIPIKCQECTHGKKKYWKEQ